MTNDSLTPERLHRLLTNSETVQGTLHDALLRTVQDNPPTFVRWTETRFDQCIPKTGELLLWIEIDNDPKSNSNGNNSGEQKVRMDIGGWPLCHVPVGKRFVFPDPIPVHALQLQNLEVITDFTDGRKMRLGWAIAGNHRLRNWIAHISSTQTLWKASEEDSYKIFQFQYFPAETDLIKLLMIDDLIDDR